MKKVFLSVVVAGTILTSCGTANKTVNLAGEWNIVSVEGQDITSDQEPFLGFDMKDGRLYGNAGCNNIMATVTVDSKEKKIEMSQVGATRMMCRDMQLEGKVLQALEKVTAYRSTDNGIELTDAKGNSLFGLKKKAVMEIEELNGEWLISKVYGKKVEVVEQIPFIMFNVSEKRVHGTGGCNIFNGNFSQKENAPESLSFGELVTTMKSGPGMKQEGVILEALNKVRNVAKHSNGTISLMDENKKEIVVLKKK